MVYFVLARPKRNLTISIEVILRILTGELAHGGIALDAHKGFIVVDIECRLECIAYLPYQDNTYLDGIANLVVDLDLLAVEVSRAERETFFSEHPFVLTVPL